MNLHSSIKALSKRDGAAAARKPKSKPRGVSADNDDGLGEAFSHMQTAGREAR
jgi:hypothetical protein